MSAQAGPIELPADALVLLIGASGAGKSSFAARCFSADAVLSSDAYRARVAGDEADQSASDAAFQLLHAAASERLAMGWLTVIDATNVRHDARLPLLEAADRFGRPPVAVVFDVSLAQCLERNTRRVGRSVPARIVRRQHRMMLRALPYLAAEGLKVYRLSGAEAVDGATVSVVDVPE
ncbi:MAG: hypothetical protein QOH61_2619 [Chloroflexota bacterium]|nr:hypothetical protein [Chloroflexota bacterium]